MRKPESYLPVVSFVAACPRCFRVVSFINVGPSLALDAERENLFLVLGAWRAKGYNVFPRSSVPSSIGEHVPSCSWKPGEHMSMMGGIGFLEVHDGD